MNTQITQKISELIMPLSNQAQTKFADILTYMELKKGDFFLKEGEICTQIGYVHKGMLRQYYSKNNKDLTEYFAYEDMFVVSLESCFNKTPTNMNIEAIESAVVYGIPYDKLILLAENDREIASFCRRFMELSLIISQRKIDSLRFVPAAERYISLMKSDPEIIKRVSLAHIASFLLMTPETLSRVRANIL